jgi:hypothetical protein
MRLRFRERLPLRTSEIVESVIPVASVTSVCETPLASMRWRRISASETGAIGRASPWQCSIKVAKDLQVILFLRRKIPPVQERIDHSDRLVQLLV